MAWARAKKACPSRIIAPQPDVGFVSGIVATIPLELTRQCQQHLSASCLKPLLLLRSAAAGPGVHCIAGSAAGRRVGVQERAARLCRAFGVCLRSAQEQHGKRGREESIYTA